MASQTKVDEEELAKALALSLQGIDLSALDKNKEEALSLNNVPPNSSQEQSWYPNLELIQILLSMGISQNAAERGLYHTGNSSADLAASWVFENIDNPNLHEPFSPKTTSVESHASIGHRGDESQSLKMVFVIDTSLGMGLGKTASQVGHATLALYKTLLLSVPEQPNLDEWEVGGAKKIVLKGTSAVHLRQLQEEAKKLNIPNIVTADAGKTQIEPGSITVLALFGRNHTVDKVTGKLSLL